MSKGDLHIHTSVSDGMLAPAQVAARAQALGMGFFALTDHNSLAGIVQAEEALDGDGPQLIRGVELTAQPEWGEEIHVLGYGFTDDCAELRELCRTICRRKREQLRQILSRLQDVGVKVDPSHMEHREDEESYRGRPVLAELLLQNGVVSTFGQAFAQYLGSRGCAYVPMRPVNPQVCIEAVHAGGGIAVLAHPRISTIDQWLQRLADMGLDGIEAYRPGLTGNEQLYVEKAAEHFGLVLTGGSDWHGRRGDVPLGSFYVHRANLAAFFEAVGAVDPAI